MTKNKIKKLAIFLLFVIMLMIVITAINLVYTSLILPQKQIYRQYQSYKDYVSALPTKKIKYAFFGDSHTRNDIHPKFINNSFNFGTATESYFVTYNKLQKILEKDNVKIDYAIFEIDLHSFSSSLLDSNVILNDLWLFSDFIPHSEMTKVINMSRAEYLLLSNFPFIGKGIEFITIATARNKTEIYRGWARDDKTVLSEKYRAKLVLDNNRVQLKNHDRINPIILDYFKKTLIYAQKSNISIVFIKYPVYRDYDNMISSNNLTKEEYYREIFKVINETVKNYYVIDDYESYINKPEYFSDADHLNAVGAETFSKRVSDELIDIKKVFIQ